MGGLSDLEGSDSLCVWSRGQWKCVCVCGHGQGTPGPGAGLLGPCGALVSTCCMPDPESGSGHGVGTKGDHYGLGGRRGKCSIGLIVQLLRLLKQDSRFEPYRNYREWPRPT